MSVGSDISRVQYEGNGSTETAYAVPFAFFNTEDLKVVVRDAGGAEQFLTEGSDYTVEMAEESPGGSVTTSEAWDATHTVTIYRHLEATQTTSYVENADFPARSHERALDKLTMLVQQLGRRVSAAFRLRETDGDASEVAKVSNSLFGITAGGAPVFRNASEVKAWLSLTAPILNFPTKVWADAGERAIAVPDFIGQVGAQTDNGTIWVSDGLSAGDWTNPSISLGAGSVTTEMLETAILSADADGLAKIADGFFTADSAGRAKMADGFLTLAKMQSIASGSLIGRASAGTGVPQVITVGDGLAFDGTTLKSAGAVPAGSVIQAVHAVYSAQASITASIPTDNTIPTSSEGTQVMTASITPNSSSSKVLVRMVFYGTPSANYNFVVSGFRSGLSAASAAKHTGLNGGVANHLELLFIDEPASTSAVTYAMRAGITNGTLYTNGDNNKLFSTAGYCSILLQEIKG